ncbi:unnamed protein product, partial [Linum tenue]
LLLPLRRLVVVAVVVIDGSRGSGSSPRFSSALRRLGKGRGLGRAGTASGRALAWGLRLREKQLKKQWTPGLEETKF